MNKQSFVNLITEKLDNKLRKRILSKIEFTNDCFNWTGTICRNYGYLQIKGKSIRIHKYIYELFFNKIVLNSVCHTCDNPKCVNPNHLFEGTHKENMGDKVKKERQFKPIGNKNGRVKITQEDVLFIRNSKLSCKELAIKYSITSDNISSIRTNRIWKNINSSIQNENK